MRFSTASPVLLSLLFAAVPDAVVGQTFRRLGACPQLGCIFPPDQADFLAGQYFDIRLEVHAPVNGSEATGDPIPDKDFKLTIGKKGGKAVDAASYFKVQEPKLENWTFKWFEDLYAKEAGKPSVVNVTAKAYRKLALYEPGTYEVTLSYKIKGKTEKTVAEWIVRDIAAARKTKNLILFIGDGMTTNMITAARLLGHKTVNGKYQSKMAMDTFPVLGHQMTHSLDSYITDSANSASALYTGHKSSVNALSVYADSSPSPFDDPKVETIAELFHRQRKGGVGIVSTAFLADATPAALTAHTRLRAEYGSVVDSFLHGNVNYTWTNWTGPDVLFGGGAEQFYANAASYKGQDYYKLFADAGYNVVYNKTQLTSTPTNKKTLGVFSKSNLAKWLDRNVYKDNLKGHKDAPDGKGGDATDQPGLKEMTLKALEILTARHSKEGFFLMSEAASIDKMMHVLDYDRALGDLLELDDTVKATFEFLSKTKQDKETLVLVTADHGHGFDVMGSVDTKYLQSQSSQRKKRAAIGTYEQSGLSQYSGSASGPSIDTNPNSAVVYTNGSHFPSTWDPRYALYAGVSANPDRREDYRVHKKGPREPAVELVKGSGDYYANPEDAPGGIEINGTLPVSNDQGVHSLTDVPVFAKGPCQEVFGGVYGNIDIFFGMAECLGLSQPKGPNKGGYGKGN